MFSTVCLAMCIPAIWHHKNTGLEHKEVNQNDKVGFNYGFDYVAD
jgi:hypothetical protein